MLNVFIFNRTPFVRFIKMFITSYSCYLFFCIEYIWYVNFTVHNAFFGFDLVYNEFVK